MFPGWRPGRYRHNLYEWAAAYIKPHTRDFFARGCRLRQVLWCLSCVLIASWKTRAHFQIWQQINPAELTAQACRRQLKLPLSRVWVLGTELPLCPDKWWASRREGLATVQLNKKKTLPGNVHDCEPKVVFFLLNKDFLVIWFVLKACHQKKHKQRGV